MDGLLFKIMGLSCGSLERYPEIDSFEKSGALLKGDVRIKGAVPKIIKIRPMTDE